MRSKRVIVILLFAVVSAFFANVDLEVYANTADAPVTLTKKAEETKTEEGTPKTADLMPLEVIYIMIASMTASTVLGGSMVVRKCKKP